MIFKIQLIKDSDNKVRTLYRKLWFYAKLGKDIEDNDVPKDCAGLFRKFNVYWIDEDSHRVMIISETDYDCMFEKIKSSGMTPVLYLEERKHYHSKPRGLGKSWGFVCSNCNIQNIAGVYYKCIECDDYKLCSVCESEKTHTQHVMLRFESPEKETSFNERFSIKKKIFHESEVPITDRVLVNLSEMLSKMVSSNGTLEPKSSAPPEYEKEKSTSQRLRRFSDATTLGWSEDVNPVAALATLFDRFRETIIQVEEKIAANTDSWTDFEKECDTKNPEGKKINKAIKELIDMGYSNSGNWLAHLLRAADGDINKALDLLKPVK